VFHKLVSSICERRGLIAALLGALSFAAASPAAAQTTTGNVRGYLRGEGGTAVADGQVTARSTEMGITRGATANAEGFYSISGLRPGTYVIEARRIGFQPQTRTITVQIGQTLDANFDLSAAATQLTTVQVIATAPFETKTSEVATNVTQAQINDLPSSSRNILDLAQLAPGVRVTPDRIDGTSKSFASGAQPSEQINVFIDGSSYKNDIITGGVSGQDASRGNPFPRNAVQEFRVSTSNFKAEYQKASSAIITAVTQSGTNDWRGSAFADYQNQSLVALDSFSIPRKNVCLATGSPASVNGTPCFQRPRYNRTLAGVSAGGPIVRDKLFIFGSYEGNLQNRQGVTRLFGTPANWPAAIAPVNGATADAPFRSHLVFGKLSYNQSEKSLIELSGDARLENDKRDFGNQFSGPDIAPSVGDNFRSNVVTGRLKHSYYGSFGTNEALVSYQWYAWKVVPFDFNTPRQQYNGIGTIGGHEAAQDLSQKRLSLRDDYTLTTRHMSGSHVPKVGFNVDFDKYGLNKQLDENPIFTFDASNNYATPIQARIGVGNPTVGSNNTQVGLYAQDDWSPTDRLTFNLGVRWDYESNMFNRGYVTPQAVRDSITQFVASGQSFVPIDPNRYFTNGSQRKGFYGGFQPRVGFSYAIDRDAMTTVFGGWGIYYDRLPFNYTIDEQYRRQHPDYVFYFGTGTGQIPWNASYFSRQGLLNVISSGQAPPTEVYLIPNDLKPPHSNQWSVGARHDFGTFNASATYQNIRSFNGLTFEWADVSFTPNQGRNCCFERRVGGNANRTYANVLVGNNDIRTWYSGVALTLDRPYRRSTRKFGWGAGVTWNIARAEQEGNDLFSFPQVRFNTRHPISDDQRHRVVANFITDIPRFWGIQFSGLATLSSGAPLNRNFNTPNGAITEFGVARQAGQTFIIPNAFAYRTLDLRLRKDFADVGGNRLGVTADLFNVYNFRNLGCFNEFAGTFTTNNGQQVFTPNLSYGQSGCTVSDPRRLQIGVAYDFGPRLGAR
jgi:hypothetical protein